MISMLVSGKTYVEKLVFVFITYNNNNNNNNNKSERIIFKALSNIMKIISKCSIENSVVVLLYFK